MKRIIFLMLGWGLCLIVQAQTTNFSKLNFGCDGSSTTSGNQWSKTVVDLLGFASHHNVAVVRLPLHAILIHKITTVTTLPEFQMDGSLQKIRKNCK